MTPQWEPKPGDVVRPLTDETGIDAQFATDITAISARESRIASLVATLRGLREQRASIDALEDAASETSALIAAANEVRSRWIDRLRAACETGTISHAQYLLARCALDRWHGLETWRIDQLFCAIHNVR